MSRYSPSTRAENRWDPSGRPPLEKLPAPVRELIVERDQLRDRLAEAQAYAAELAQPASDAEAKRADDDAATTAARAGEQIPERRQAEAQLAADRERAAAQLAAQTAAFSECTDELEQLVEWQLVPAVREKRAVKLARSRDKIAAAAQRLADAVDAAVVEDSADLWLVSGLYQPRAQVLDSDFINTRRPGQAAIPGRPVDVRDVIKQAAVSCLEG